MYWLLNQEKANNCSKCNSERTLHISALDNEAREGAPYAIIFGMREQAFLNVSLFSSEK